jgi:hypothetical protein
MVDAIRRRRAWPSLFVLVERSSDTHNDVLLGTETEVGVQPPG